MVASPEGLKLAKKSADYHGMKIGMDQQVAELSQRELNVLELLTMGKSNKEIARALNIGSQTVKTHLSHIFRKLGTADRAGAVAVAFRKGLVS